MSPPPKKGAFLGQDQARGTGPGTTAVLSALPPATHSPSPHLPEHSPTSLPSASPSPLRSDLNAATLRTFITSWEE